MPTLNWLTRDEDLTAAERVPYRLLEEFPELSYTDKDPATENMLIQGDNLEALKSLLPFYAGKVKCIFIDPPYNSKSANITNYDDNLEHSQWLQLIYPRLELLREFLATDGVLFVVLDDREIHYLKVVLDEIFGRKNFCGSLVWEKKKKPSFLNANMGTVTDYVLAYALSRSDSPAFRYGATTANKMTPLNNAGNSEGTLNFRAGSVGFGCKDGSFEPQDMSEGNIVCVLLDPLLIREGRNVGDFRMRGEWRYSQVKLNEVIDADGRIWISKVPFRPNHIKDGGEPKKLKNLLSVAHYGMATNEDATDESRALFGDVDAFDYPKPEKLAQILISAVTQEDDMVMDSFLGSGTTTAVAQKMGRRYIGIEMGDHAVTHCVPRMKKVVDGEQGGISEAVGWKGGGGFRFYRLGKTVFDEDGQINPEIRFAALAAHIWFSETRTPLGRVKKTPKLGVHEGTAYYLLYNGVLGDKRPDGGNVLTRKVLAELAPHDGPRVIYGESSRLGAETLKAMGIVFKQTPYDVRAR